MPHLRKSVQDLVRHYDRHLALQWCRRRERWVLVRYVPFAAGKFHELLVFQNDDGSFREPTEHSVGEWMKQNDLAKVPGATHRDKVRNFLRMKNERNQRLKEEKMREGAGERYGLFKDYVDAASKDTTGDPKVVRDKVRRRKELVDQMDLSERQKKRILSGREELS